MDDNTYSHLTAHLAEKLVRENDELRRAMAILYNEYLKIAEVALSKDKGVDRLHIKYSREKMDNLLSPVMGWDAPLQAAMRELIKGGK